MKLIDLPVAYKLADYNKAIDEQVQQLSKIDDVVSIYQIGSVSTPGVSDIDLLVVFKNNTVCHQNPKGGNTDSYLFTHTLYGCSEEHFIESFNFTFFHNHKLLYGKDFTIVNKLPPEDQQQLKEQIAVEFLVKMYINLLVQKSYKTVKLRALFLHIKALVYDFEFLNRHPERLLGLINQGISYRNNWLSNEISKKTMVNWFNDFFDEFEQSLRSILQEFPLHFPVEKFNIAPNMEIKNSIDLKFSRQGIVVPDVFNILNRKYFKLLNRFNIFKIKVPIDNVYPNVVQDYFNYVTKSSEYNARYLPHFMPLTSSLKIYKK